MKKKILILYILFSLIVPLISIYAQIECGTPETCDVPQLVERGGYLKPERTDKDNGNPAPIDATFKMLFVFVQFQGETGPDGDWPKGDNQII
jgi:hypothetical protein